MYICSSKTNSRMKTSKNTNDYVAIMAVIMPRNNGSEKGLSALAASLVRGKELSK